MYYKCYDMRYIFHVMRSLHLVHRIQSAHFVYLGKIPFAKNAVCSGGIQDNKQKIQSTILLYMLYYSSLMYHEITTKSFVRPTVILCRL